jgi:putative endonuclease
MPEFTSSQDPYPTHTSPRTAKLPNMKLPCIYMMCNRPNGTIYVGVTSDLVKRAWQHRTHAMGGFTAKYGLGTLVWYERCDEMAVAIAREKQLKGGPRAQKIALIVAMNPTWRDLYNDIL